MFKKWKYVLGKEEFFCMSLMDQQRKLIFGITIDNKRTFDSNIKGICRKPGKKVNALFRISPYLKQIKKNCYLKVWWNHNLVSFCL